MRLLIIAALTFNSLGHPSSPFTSVSGMSGDPDLRTSAGNFGVADVQAVAAGSRDEDVENTTRWLMSLCDGC